MALGWRRSDDTSIRVLPAAYRGDALHAANRHAARRRKARTSPETFWRAPVHIWRRLFGR
jgi:hypothetical protein